MPAQLSRTHAPRRYTPTVFLIGKTVLFSVLPFLSISTVISLPFDFSISDFNSSFVLIFVLFTFFIISFTLSPPSFAGQTYFHRRSSFQA